MKKQVAARSRDYTGEIARIAANADKYASLFKCRNLLSGHLRKITRARVINYSDLFSAEEIEKIKAKRKADQARKRKQRQDQIAKFKNYDLSYLHNHNYTYMRLTGDVIETSKGIKINLQQARQVFDIWKRAETNNTTYNPGLSISGYRVDQISPEYIRAGCHLIPRAEIKEIANNLKWE